MLQNRRTTRNSKLIYTKKFYILSASAYIIIIVWLIAASHLEGQTPIVVCPSKWLFHIPCPGCGITRATLLALRGEVLSALLLNPNVALCLLFLLGYPLLGLLSLLTHRHLLPQIYLQLNKTLSAKVVLYGVLLFELTVWVANIYRGI